MKNEKYVLIVENGTESLKKNESVTTSSNKFLLSGPFTEFDIENRNKRFYTAQNFIPVMNSLLEKRKMLGVLYGEFDHPDVFDIAGKNASHAIESLVHNESGNRIDGSIALLSTHYGKEARAIINDGYPLFVSSRAAGVTDGNGNVALKELFTYDIVLDPGFASARVSVNESCGFKSTPDVPYRIYEMKDEQVNNLFLDNKNDSKTAMDLKQMDMMFANEAAKLEHLIMTKISEGKTAPEDIKALVEKYDNVNEELNTVKEYLKFIQTKMSHMVIENTKLVEENKKLLYEMNENTAYANHLASSLKKLNTYATDIETRLGVGEKMIEYVAEHTKANILFSEDIAETLKNNTEFLEYTAKETEITQKFVESIAKETEITQKFAENIALETEIAQKFAENIAKETEIAQKFAEHVAVEVKDTQGLLEHVASEANKDGVWLNYIAEKVDGIVGYNVKTLERIKTSIPVNENASTEDSIHTLEPLTDYLGIEEEQEVAANIAIENQPTNVDVIDIEPTEVPTAKDVADDVQPDAVLPTLADASDLPLVTEIPTDNVQPEVQPEIEPSNIVISSLVKIKGTDETGIVMEVTPEKITVKKSGSDETTELNVDDVEVIEDEDNITEKVSNVLAEIKKQKVLANQQPHFYTFLSEQQISDFKVLDAKTRETITLALNESEYFNTEDVLKVIGKSLNEKAMSYEDKLISNVPVTLKEAWNSFSQDQKVSMITESKYFNLVTSADVVNFWNTRPFAKAILSPEAIMIKESLTTQDNEKLSDSYVDSFLKSMDNLNSK